MGIMNKLLYGMEEGSYFRANTTIRKPVLPFLPMYDDCVFPGDICRVRKVYVDSRQGTRQIDFIVVTGKDTGHTYEAPLKLFRKVFEEISKFDAEKIILLKTI